MATKTSPPPNLVTVHPLVLLSVVDHYNRVAKDTKKRVVGVLLGEINKGVVDVTNSYAGTAPNLHFLLFLDLVWLKVKNLANSALRGGSSQARNMVCGPQLSRKHVCNVQESKW